MEYNGLHHVRQAAKERERQRRAYLIQQQELQRYYQQQLFIHQRRLAIFSSNLEYLTRTAPTIRDIHQQIPSHFSFFSYNIHDKDAFKKSISRTEEKPMKKIQPPNRWGSVKKEKGSSSKQQHSYTLFPPN